MISTRTLWLWLVLATMLGAGPVAADATCDRLFARLRIAGTQLSGTAATVAIFPFSVHTSWTTSYFVPPRNSRFTGLTNLSLTTQPNGDLFGSGIRTNTTLTGIPPSGTQQVSLRIRADGLVVFNNEFGPYDPTCPLPLAAPVRNPNDVFAVVASGDSVEAFNFKPGGLLPATWLAHLPVDGMTLLGNGVFFTTHEAAGPRVYGIAQTGVNGQQIALYGEPDVNTKFGDIVASNASGGPFGYVWTQNANGARIKRVHLADPNQAPIVLAGPVRNLDIAVSHRNLATDNEALYWQEARAVKKLLLSGGAVVDLVQTNGAPLAGVHLRGTTLFFADGNVVKSVSVGGGPVTTVATANATVLSITPAANGVYWGDASGAITGIIGNALVSVIPSGSGSANATSLAFDGTRVVATECTGATNCSVFMQHFPSTGLNVGLAAGPKAHFIAFNSQGKPFWGDDTGVRRIP